MLASTAAVPCGAAARASWLSPVRPDAPLALSEPSRLASSSSARSAGIVAEIHFNTVDRTQGEAGEGRQLQGAGTQKGLLRLRPQPLQPRQGRPSSRPAQ